MPASELADALKQIRELQRMLGKKTMEAEVLKEALEIARSRKWLARSHLLPGTTSESLGVARSQLTARLKQPDPESRPRRRRALNDGVLIEQIKQAVGALPSYGYRQVWGLLRRQHEQQALPPVNVKRIYHLMRDHDLLQSGGANSRAWHGVTKVVLLWTCIPVS